MYTRGILKNLVLCLLALSSISCAKKQATPNVFWEDLMRELLHVERVARLDTRTAYLRSSFDPTGGNNDFNQYLREGPEGWWVIADLEGPGYISRFWFTGSDEHHRVRFYFDNEEEPRVDMTIGEFCGGTDTYRAPLAVYENYCWYNLIPMAYAERLVIMVEKGGYKPGNWPRLFYQVNYHPLDPGEHIASFPGSFTEEEKALIESVRQAWAQGLPQDIPSAWRHATQEHVIYPGETVSWTVSDQTPGILQRLELTPDYEALPSARAREDILRSMVMKLYWDDQSSPSVAAPLGDFFGAFWRRNRYEALYVGAQDDTFYTRFPMPFATAARLELVNQGSEPVPITAAWWVEDLNSKDETLGYFHAAWQRTTPADAGSPHVSLSASGKGKLVGSMLSVTSADRSWWILEADEMIRVDDERAPGWKGTGLEDYFNGGWYYQNPIIRLLAGIPFKMPFRVLQYRFHLMDPVHFEHSIDMMFERGPDNASRGWMETMAYYYKDKPDASGSRLLTPSERIPPDDGLAQATIMHELNNMERIGDYAGASDLIDVFLERFPEFPYAETLRLRQLAYIEHREGIEVARPLYEAFAEKDLQPATRAQLENLLWFHEDPSHALISGYSNTRMALFLNGKAIAAIESPEEMSVHRVRVEPGPQALGFQVRFHPYPNWSQVYLRTHYGDVFTKPDWRWCLGPRGAWTQPGYTEGDAWERVGGTGVKGPPEVPYVWVVPHAYVNMQSIAVGLRPSREWEDHSILAAFRHEFDLSATP